MKTTRVVIAHDYITQRGGAERVALTLAQAYPSDPLYTAIYNPPTTFPAFQSASISTSLLNRIPVFRRNPQLALPLLHFAWSMRKPVTADVVVASSSGWSHGVRVGRNTLKVVYCHNPPRWLYQKEDYLEGRSALVRLSLRLVSPMLLRWDRKAAKTVDLYIANSSSVAERVKRAYGVEASIVHPPVGLSRDGDQVAVGGLSEGFFLTVGRKRGYKGTDRLIEAFRHLPDEQLVIVGGSDLPLPRNVSILEGVTDAQLRWLYKHAKAFISVSREDFGLSPLEANSFGTPCLLVQAGGFVDSTREGVSGVFLRGISRDEIIASIQQFPKEWEEDAILEHADRFSVDAFIRRIEDSIFGALGERLDRQACENGDLPDSRISTPQRSDDE